MMKAVQQLRHDSGGLHGQVADTQCSMVSLLESEQKAQQVQRCQKPDYLAQKKVSVSYQHYEPPRFWH